MGGRRRPAPRQPPGRTATGAAAARREPHRHDQNRHRARRHGLTGGDAAAVGARVHAALTFLENPMSRMRRREFLNLSALAAGGALLTPGLTFANATHGKSRLVVVILRGAIQSGTLTGSQRVEVQIRLANAQHELKGTREVPESDRQGRQDGSDPADAADGPAPRGRGGAAQDRAHRPDAPQRRLLPRASRGSSFSTHSSPHSRSSCSPRSSGG